MHIPEQAEYTYWYKIASPLMLWRWNTVTVKTQER